MIYFPRRSSSRSTASRMKSVRSSPSFSAAEMRANVPSGNLACMFSDQSRGLPTGAGISDTTFFAKPALFLISPIDLRTSYHLYKSYQERRQAMTNLSNQPKLSTRAQHALDLLADGGEIQYRLERNSYTGREQFQTRFCRSTSWGSAVKGLGHATRAELERAGFRFQAVHRTSVSTSYRLEHA